MNRSTNNKMLTADMITTFLLCDTTGLMAVHCDRSLRKRLMQHVFWIVYSTSEESFISTVYRSIYVIQ